MKSAMQIEDNARVMIPANNQNQEIVANAPTPDLVSHWQCCQSQRYERDRKGNKPEPSESLQSLVGKQLSKV